MNLLFTGGGGAATQALDDVLNGPHCVHFADADSEAKPPSIDADRWHVIPPAKAKHGLNNPAFVPALAELCERLAVDLLVPGVDEELRQLAYAGPGRVLFPCAILLPAYEFVATHLDKLSSMAQLSRLGIPVPRTARMQPRKGELEWPATPCVVKPREGRGSRDVAVVHSALEGWAHLILTRRNPADFITQEYLRGQEYTVTVVADRCKRVRAIVPVRVDVKRGITLRAEIDPDPAVIQACLHIHAVDPFAGCVNMQVVKTGIGQVLPFEINPRVSTTTCLAIAAGVDVIGLYLDDSPTVGACASYVPMALKRTWHTELVEC